MDANTRTEWTVGAAIEVQRRLGPGLQERLLNFNVPVLREGICRRDLNVPDSSSQR